jgi:hypothetical protein
MKLAHYYRATLKISFGECQKLAWATARDTWQFVQFTKKSGEQVERLVYRTEFNKEAVRGGVRTCPTHYTLHIEVQNGIPSPVEDFNPITVKWLACTNQMYRSVTRR